MPLVCFDVASGETHWRFDAGDAVTTTPTVIDGFVLFGSFDGHIRAVREEDARWKTGIVRCNQQSVIVDPSSRRYKLVELPELPRSIRSKPAG